MRLNIFNLNEEKNIVANSNDGIQVNESPVRIQVSPDEC